MLKGPEIVRVSKFYKESKDGKFVSFLSPDARTLYHTFRKGAKESSELIARFVSNMPTNY